MNKLLALLLLGMCLAAHADVIEHCTNSTSLEITCGFPQVEDMTAIENSQQFIFAEYGGSTRKAGRLGLYSPKTQSYSILFGSNSAADIQGESWGEANCQWPSLISPHGLHLSRRSNAAGYSQQLLLINHGEQEQVLFFELVGQQEASTAEIRYSLAPKGCVTFPAFAKLNDVVALDGGDFAATHMFQANQKVASQFKALLGYDTGFVYHWNKQTGLTALDGSDGILPNGIETNQKKDLLFVNMYFGDSMNIYSLKQHKYIYSFKVEKPDNSSWSASGELLIASHHTSLLEILGCFDIEKGSCGGAFDIVAFDPRTHESRLVYTNQGGEAFGPATTAVEFEEEQSVKLLMGSYSGDRIARTRHAVHY